MNNSVFVDASFNHSKAKAAIGGFVSEDNLVVVQFSNKINVYDSNIAEMYAIENGLLLAKARGISELTLFSDSKSCVDFLDRFLYSQDIMPRRIKLYNKDRALFLRVFFLINSFKKIVIKHIMRRFNGVANILSNVVFKKIEIKKIYFQYISNAFEFNSTITGEVYV